MKKIYGLIWALALSAGLFAQKVNDPNAEVREAKNYTGIDVADAFSVYLSQSDQEAVAVSAAEPKFRDRIKVEVKEGILHVWYEGEGKWSTGNKKLKVYISFKNITKLVFGGACDIFSSGTITADELRVNLSGASDMKAKLEVKGGLSVSLSGASDMTISGMANDLKVEATGASDFKGFEMSVETCDARATGASDIRVTVNKEISARASGASDIKFKGSAVMHDSKSNGASKVSKGR